MKVVCIYNKGWEKWITLGKTYEIIRINEDGDYWIIDDENDELWVAKEWFKSLSEIRNEKIDELLNDEN
jgi:hypothetical protein